MSNSNAKNQFTIAVFMYVLSFGCGMYAFFDSGVNIFVLVIALVAFFVAATNLWFVYDYLDHVMPTDILCDPVSFYARYLVPTARGMASIEVNGLSNGPTINYHVIKKVDGNFDQYLNGHNDEFCFFHHYPNHFVFDSLPEVFASLERWQKKVKLPTS